MGLVQMSETAKLALGGAGVVALLLLIGLGSLTSSRPLEAFVFYVFAAVTVVSCVAIITSQNIIRAAMWLLGTLGAAAGFYFLLAANFLAAIQLIVYAGGVLVLIVFGVMLTARTPYFRFAPSVREVILAAGVGCVLFVGLIVALLGGGAGAWPAIPGAVPSLVISSVADLGRALLTDYLLPFEVVSVLLLAVMIGAAHLARPTRRGS